MIVKAKIGAIEFSGDEVRVAVIKTGRKLPRILDLQVRTAVYPSAEDRFEALVRALDEALDALNTHPTTYVLCVPSAFTIVRSLTIPFKGQNRVAKAVPFEIEPHLAFPLEELLLDFTTIAEIEGTTEVLAVGVRRKHLEEQLAILAAVGVEPELAAVDAAGMSALWLAAHKSQKGLKALVHVRETSSVVVILYNNTLAYFRHLYFGRQELSENPGAAAREVQNTLRAFLAKWRLGGEIDLLSLTGIEMGDEDAQLFENTLGYPVECFSIISRIKGGSSTLNRLGDDGTANRWEAAIGSAYNAGGGGIILNLMKDNQQIHGAVRGVIAHLMFSACLALLFLLGGAWYYHEGRLRNEAVIEQVKADIGQLKQEIETMAADGLGEDVEFAVFGDPPLLDIFKEISERMPDSKVNISEIRVAQSGARGGWVNIIGSTSNAADFNASFEQLKQSKMFKLAEDTDIKLQGEKTTFRVRAFRPEEEISEDQS